VEPDEVIPRTRVAVGVLLIVCSVASILSAVPFGSTLDGSDYLRKLATAYNRVIVTALLEFVWAATGAGIAIALYPVIREDSRALALGAVVGRVVEAVFILIGTLSAAPVEPQPRVACGPVRGIRLSHHRRCAARRP
jgi:hypothetical protein